jgi:nicotinate-nucleotide adenylyltransferase
VSGGRLGVYGGSFDPVHWGHLHVALLAREAAGLDEVLFVPASRPPHKPDRDLSAPEHRLAMLRAALAAEPRTAISALELEAGGPRYTVDTLARIRSERPGVELHFILGQDSLRDLPQWREPERILAENRVIAVNRPGLDPGTVAPELASRVLMVGGNPFAISASEVRRRAAAGLAIHHLVPEPVAVYISKHGLYREPAPGD